MKSTSARPAKGYGWIRERYFISPKKASLIQRELDEAIKYGKPSEKSCPRTGKVMQEIALKKSDLLLDYSPASGGLWFDGGELAKLTGYFSKYFKLGFEKPRERVESAYFRRLVSIPPLPNLVLRSLGVVAALYGLLSLILITLNLFTGLLPSLALALERRCYTYIGKYVLGIILIILGLLVILHSKQLI